MQMKSYLCRALLVPLTVVALAAFAPGPDPLTEAPVQGADILLDIALREAETAGEYCLLEVVAVAFARAGREEEASRLATMALLNALEDRDGDDIFSWLRPSHLCGWADSEAYATLRGAMLPEDLELAEDRVLSFDPEAGIEEEPESVAGPQPRSLRFGARARDWPIRLKESLIRELSSRWLARGNPERAWKLAQRMQGPGCDPWAAARRRVGLSGDGCRMGWWVVGEGAVAALLASGADARAREMAAEMAALGGWSGGDASLLALSGGPIEERELLQVSLLAAEAEEEARDLLLRAVARLHIWAGNHEEGLAVAAGIEDPLIADLESDVLRHLFYFGEPGAAAKYSLDLADPAGGVLQLLGIFGWDDDPERGVSALRLATDMVERQRQEGADMELDPPLATLEEKLGEAWESLAHPQPTLTLRHPNFYYPDIPALPMERGLAEPELVLWAAGLPSAWDRVILAVKLHGLLSKEPSTPELTAAMRSWAEQSLAAEGPPE